MPTPAGTTVEARLGTARGASVVQVLLGPAAVLVARYGAGIIMTRSLGARTEEAVYANSDVLLDPLEEVLNEMSPFAGFALKFRWVAPVGFGRNDGLSFGL